MSTNSSRLGLSSPKHFDVVVIGAGFSGLYALHRFREAGLRVIGLEAGTGVGGTWFWNRYPGARVDIESMQYSYSFDDALQQEWSWTEHFAPQPEIEEYANHVADRFQLKELIQFSTRVTKLTFDSSNDLWNVGTESGVDFVTKYVVAATGSLDTSNVPRWPGMETFKGEIHHTSRWPKNGVELDGKRVGLIGTGSTGIQVTPEVAAVAEHLTVFQRTPNFVLPCDNRKMSPQYEREWKKSYARLRKEALSAPGAVIMNNTAKAGSIFDYTEAQRLEIMERAWNSRSGLEFIRTFTDTSTNLEANDILAEFVRSKIRGIVHDPKTAELLSPTTYPIGSKRICMASNYYETFNRPNVELVDVNAFPIEQITESGLRTTASEFELDTIILATGFDAMTGSLLQMNISGIGGMNLEEKWEDGPTTALGLMVSGFPNFFMVHGPGSPSVLAQMITTGEWQVDWICRTIEWARRQQLSRFQATPQQEEDWSLELERVAAPTLYSKAASWYVGANIPGKPRRLMMYVGGFSRYSELCTRASENGYQEFAKT